MTERIDARDPSLTESAVTPKWRHVILESPYTGRTPAEIYLNICYGRLCMSDCLRRGDAPFASHLLYTQPTVLRDGKPEERRRGMHAGFSYRTIIKVSVVYTDLGVSDGMREGLVGRVFEERRLFPELDLASVPARVFGFEFAGHPGWYGPRRTRAQRDEA